MDKKNRTRSARADREMRKLITFVKNSEQVDEAEIEASWVRVRALSVRESARKKKIRTASIALVALSVAACVAFLFVLSYPLFRSAEPSVLGELEKGAGALDRLDEIRLVASGSQPVELESEAVVAYDNAGLLTVNGDLSAVDRVPEEKRGSELNHLIVPKGKRVHVTLSDGTRMYVNAASHVIYPSVFGKDKREIAVEGEVYLEVAHKPEAPFYVKTKGLSVKVLGTVFNVQAYKEQCVSVVLVQGRVEVEASASEKMVLGPSQKASLKDGLMKKEEVDVEKYVCWKDNVMLLDNDPVSEVLDNLSRYYGVALWYDEQVANRKLSGKLDLCESVDEVMDIIKESASLNMEKVEGGGFRVHQ